MTCTTSAASTCATATSPSTTWTIAEYIVKIPKGLKDVGVLLEPTTVVEKGIAQAYEIQRRLRVWQPRKAAVMGAGTIGLLAALVLRLRGLDVTVFGQRRPPYLNSDLVEALGARYESHRRRRRSWRARSSTGHSTSSSRPRALAGRVREHAGARQERRAGAVQRHRRRRLIQVPADRINLEFVLGNKVMVGTVNANREYFETRREGHGARPRRSTPAGSVSC